MADCMIALNAVIKSRALCAADGLEFVAAPKTTIRHVARRTANLRIRGSPFLEGRIPIAPKRVWSIDPNQLQRRYVGRATEGEAESRNRHLDSALQCTSWQA
jgi:hypothetical protein